MTTSLHTVLTAKGQSLHLVEDGPALFTITYVHERNWSTPWCLHDTAHANTLRDYWFKSLEGAQYYALHLVAEAAVDVPTGGTDVLDG